MENSWCIKVQKQCAQILLETWFNDLYILIEQIPEQSSTILQLSYPLILLSL